MRRGVPTFGPGASKVNAQLRMGTLACRFPVASRCYPLLQGRVIDSRGTISRDSCHRPVT